MQSWLGTSGTSILDARVATGRSAASHVVFFSNRGRVRLVGFSVPEWAGVAVEAAAAAAAVVAEAAVATRPEAAVATRPEAAAQAVAAANLARRASSRSTSASRRWAMPGRSTTRCMRLLR